MKSSPTVRGFVGGALVALVVAVSFGFAPGEREGMSTKTPAEFVATYGTLADAILGVEKTERNLVRSILATAYGHAEGIAARLRESLKGGEAEKAKKGFEDLATLVAQLSTEGDNAVGSVRKRLLEGGHHSNAEGEAKGIFEEGYVVVTRVAKKSFLDSSRAIAQMARNPSADGLEAEWKKVVATYAEIMKAK